MKDFSQKLNKSRNYENEKTHFIIKSWNNDNFSPDV